MAVFEQLDAAKWRLFLVVEEDGKVNLFCAN